MGSEKLEEREGALGPAKHPQSQLFYDAKFPPKAQLSKIPVQIKQEEGGNFERRPTAVVGTLHLQVFLPFPSPHPLFLLKPSHPQLSTTLYPSIPLIHPLLPGKGPNPVPTSGLRAAPRPVALQSRSCLVQPPRAQTPGRYRAIYRCDSVSLRLPCGPSK